MKQQKRHEPPGHQTEAVSYEELRSTIGRAKALRLVILDACRVNPFKERMNRTMARPAQALTGDWRRHLNRHREC